LASKLSRHERIRYFLLIQLKPKHQGFKANAATGHQKHERRRLQSGVVRCCPLRL